MTYFGLACRISPSPGAALLVASSKSPEGGSNTLHPRQSHGLEGQDLDRPEKTTLWRRGRSDRLKRSQKGLIVAATAAIRWTREVVTGECSRGGIGLCHNTLIDRIKEILVRR